jgi:hypothetical protein
MSKREHLCLYDYGQGGLWVIILAATESQITERYPQLQVFRSAPTNLDRATLQAIRNAGVQDIDESPRGWLADLAVEHGAQPGGPA